jgi:hypothetical protein
VKPTILPHELPQSDPQQNDSQKPDPQRRKWYLTQEAFDQFLLLLDPDRDRARELYGTLRRNLVQLFVWRRCRDSEDHADENHQSRHPQD